MSYSTFQLGPLALSVSGDDDNPVFGAVHEELSVLNEAETEQCDINFHFVDQLEIPKHSLHVGKWRLFNGGLMGRGGGYRYILRRGTQGFDVQIVTTKGRRPLNDHYKRAWNWNFLAPWETTAKNFMYDLFDLVAGAAVLEKNASYLHASTCCRNEEGLALIAWGGIGKTTSVLKLVNEDRWKYLSDDLGLVDGDGRLWRTPRRLQIYAYNLEGQPQLFDQVMEGRGPIDRINWHWRLFRFGGKKVRRRIDAEELFGPELVGDSAPLKRAIFLERADVSQMQWSELDTDELAHRSATILIDELNTLTDVAVAAESHGIDVGIPGVEELRANSRDILTRAFADVPTHLLRIPVDADPDELAHSLRDKL
jgi:hypothetical protein